MIQENELITFILCVGALTFFLINYLKMRSLPALLIFMISFIFFLMGWFFTVIEGVIFEDIFNLIEHVCYICSSLMMLIWALIFFKKRGGNDFKKY